eukprot:Plantae.Rhodophyta-Purpureofilum_apyrenoidigerum.ctg5124.p1 GENE.Plantae.Rhodophyta-Purpureofilum_apyrenoidigerum.ctg5124~~Plantae.Rhodophyta-Purpureofilum_apyrenoidigerum.ctg5124.p1  ORF type:complete len:372 (+),score=55.76 Plantae.Rhodophyta-Purpureofilum_apyrenoidigerum.ctg5124:1176-2291(+)
MSVNWDRRTRLVWRTGERKCDVDRGVNNARTRILIAIIGSAVVAVMADEVIRESFGSMLGRDPLTQRVQDLPWLQSNNPQPQTVDVQPQADIVRPHSRPRFCNESVAHFRFSMSEECRDLWRPDLPARNPPRKFNYLHMPKAGTSFTTSLRNFMPSCPTKDVACPHRKIDDRDLRCYGKLIACNGHHHFENKFLNKYVQNPKSGQAYVTMLRDPGRRLVSAKNHDCHRHIGKHKVVQLPKDCANLTYYEFADLEFIQNCQTKMLTQYDCAGSVAVEKISLGTAKHNLKSLDFFGITEEWAASVRMFHCQFGGEVRASEMLNSRPGDYSNDEHEEVLEYVRNVEKLDMQLYDYATDLFHKRMKCLECPAECI